MTHPKIVSSARRCDFAAGVLLLALTVFRLFYAATHELVEDEAYYWQWSRHLDFGYYDNTPLMAFVIRFFTLIFGPTELGVRAGAVFCALIASVFIYLLAKRLLGPGVALVSVALANFVPLFAAGAVLMTQDPVQLALWAAAVYVISRAVTDRPGFWPLAGLLAGLAAQAKLNALLLLPSVFVYLLLSRSPLLRRPSPYLAGLLALVIFAPFLWWNHTHGDAFTQHMASMSRRGANDGPVKLLGNFLGAQLLLLSPFVFLTYLFTLYDGARGIGKEAPPAPNSGGAGVGEEIGGNVFDLTPPNLGAGGRLFLWSFSATVFAAVLVVALRSKVEGNWAVAAYVTGLILTADALTRAWKRGIGGKIWAGFSVGVAVFLSVVVLYPQILYAAGVKLKPKADRTNGLYGWKTMAERVSSERQTMGTDPFVFSVNYRMPSEAAFYLPGQPETYSLFLHDRANEYAFWFDPSSLVGRDAVFVQDSDNQDHLPDVRAVFSRVEPQPPLLIYRPFPYKTTPIRTLQIWRCYGFKGYERRRWQNGW